MERLIAEDVAIATQTDDLDTLFELSREGENVTSDLERELKTFTALLDRVETAMLLSGENDARWAIVTIHPGAGGTESQDWAEMLLRMYLRWAERERFQTVVTDRLEGEGAGIKSVTFEVNGENAYGLLQSEIGVHRLVRISPFDANARRHTSFASVFVYPQVDDEIKIDIRLDDLRIDTFRSSGAGGQHVNMTDSAVRITHFPTGIVETRKTEDSKLEINFGSQIRNYVLAPYRLAKDLRSKLAIGDVDRVLEGDLEPFMHAFLVWRKTGKIAGDDKDEAPE